MRTGLAAQRLRERKRHLETERQERQRVEFREVTEGMAETIALERERGAEIITPPAERGGRTKPARRIKGLAWLVERKRITPRQAEAGRRYGVLYSVVESGDVKSCLAFMEIRAPANSLHPGDVKVWARHKLKEAREILVGHTAMIFAMDQVCGLDKTPREIVPLQREAERLTERLGIALDLLVKAWGIG